MSLPELPASIPRARVIASVQGLGIDPAEVTSVLWSPGEITVTRYRVDEHGKRINDGDAYDTATTSIPVRD
jgi:hypothetical protein